MPRASFLSKNSVEREVNGKKVRFYAVSLEAGFGLSALIQPIASSLSVLFGSEDRDYVESERSEMTDYSPRTGERLPMPKTKDELGLRPFEGVTQRKSLVKAIDPKLAEMRKASREKAIADLLESVTRPDGKAAIGRLLMDSMRDEFPNALKASDEELQSFMGEIDLETLPVLISGLAEANKKLFAPLAPFRQSVTAKVKRVLDVALEKEKKDPATESKPNLEIVPNDPADPPSSPSMTETTGGS